MLFILAEYCETSNVTISVMLDCLVGLGLLFLLPCALEDERIICIKSDKVL